MTGGPGPGFCPRCHPARTPEGEALAELIARWVEAIPEERRADAPLRRQRLERCQACPHLNEGVCALCGCYVEYRAAQAIRRCPDVPGRW